MARTAGQQVWSWILGKVLELVFTLIKPFDLLEVSSFQTNLCPQFSLETLYEQMPHFIFYYVDVC